MNQLPERILNFAQMFALFCIRVQNEVFDRVEKRAVIETELRKSARQLAQDLERTDVYPLEMVLQNAAQTLSTRMVAFLRDPMRAERELYHTLCAAMSMLGTCSVKLPNRWRLVESTELKKVVRRWAGRAQERDVALRLCHHLDLLLHVACNPGARERDWYDVASEAYTHCQIALWLLDCDAIGLLGDCRAALSRAIIGRMTVEDNAIRDREQGLEAPPRDKVSYQQISDYIADARTALLSCWREPRMTRLPEPTTIITPVNEPEKRVGAVVNTVPVADSGTEAARSDRKAPPGTLEERERSLRVDGYTSTTIRDLVAVLKMSSTEIHKQIKQGRLHPKVVQLEAPGKRTKTFALEALLKKRRKKSKTS